jgi:hypothetical protein
MAQRRSGVSLHGAAAFALGRRAHRAGLRGAWRCR